MNLSGQSYGAGRGRSAASASFLAAKAELLWTQDAMLSEELEATHPTKAAERRRFVEGVLEFDWERRGRASGSEA